MHLQCYHKINFNYLVDEKWSEIEHYLKIIACVYMQTAFDTDRYEVSQLLQLIISISVNINSTSYSLALYIHVHVILYTCICVKICFVS